VKYQVKRSPLNVDNKVQKNKKSKEKPIQLEFLTLKCQIRSLIRIIYSMSCTYIFHWNLVDCFLRLSTQKISIMHQTQEKQQNWTNFHKFFPPKWYQALWEEIYKTAYNFKTLKDNKFWHLSFSSYDKKKHFLKCAVKIAMLNEFLLLSGYRKPINDSLLSVIRVNIA